MNEDSMPVVLARSEEALSLGSEGFDGKDGGEFCGLSRHWTPAAVI